MKRLLSICLLTLTGCGTSTPDVPVGPGPVRILPMVTRVTGTNFDPEDRIGLTITTATGTYAENRELRYDGSSFSSSDLLWYNDLTQPCELCACYPYDPSGMPELFTIPSDQSGGLSQADLLAARRSSVLPGIAPVEMLFDHLMSKVRLKIENRSEGKVSEVTISGSIPTARIDWQAKSAAVEPETAPVSLIPFRVDNDTFEAVVVPQRAAFTIGISTDDGKSRSYELEPAELLGGKLYTVTVTVTRIDVSCTLSGEINDWVPGGALQERAERPDPPTVDYEGVSYRTVTLPDGSCWLAENLRYNPGPESDLDTGASGVRYPDDGLSDAASVAKYGLLYDCATAGGICPPGWSLPGLQDYEGLQEGFPEGFLIPTPALWQPATDGYKRFTDRSYFWSSIPDGEGFKMIAVRLSMPLPEFAIETKNSKICAPVRCVKRE